MYTLPSAVGKKSRVFLGYYDESKIWEKFTVGLASSQKVYDFRPANFHEFQLVKFSLGYS
jgi:hypothetical protein